MTACILYGTVAIHIAQLAEAAAIRVIGWIREAIDDDRVVIAVEDLADTTIQFVVGNGGPEGWLRVTDLGHITHLGIEHLCAIIGIIGVAILRWTVGGGRCAREAVVW